MPKKVFLTGASRGIGYEITQALLARGYEVWGTSRHPDFLFRAPGFHPVGLDLEDPDQVREAFQEAEKEAEGFDVLVNNAGLGLAGPVERFTPDLLDRQYRVLLRGPWELIRMALPGMRKRGSGTIVNISSLAGRFPVPFMGPYSAFKAGLSSLSFCLRLELAGTGIRVIDFQPGDLRTSMRSATRRLEEKELLPYQPWFDRVWEITGKRFEESPGPEIAAMCLVRLLESPNPPPVATVGSFFQASLAPFLARFATARWVEWFLRRYYGLP
jgi:NAD(P)-dependent dehydrogenase (short-subunit alcohol dehydrogenase family)